MAQQIRSVSCDGLLDEPRPGRPRVVGDDQIEALITATLVTTPPNANALVDASMAEHLGLSQSMVSRVWRAFGLVPHKQDSSKLSKDPLFVAKVRDIAFPMLPGTPARATHDYVRHGTSSLYAALDLGTGKVIGSLHSRRRSQEFLASLTKIDAEVPADLECHVVLS